MSIALRIAACLLTFAGTLCPSTALSDEAALRRTAPDECIAWFSWAGLDALGKDGAATKNRTEQLLADEEVRAFLDSLTKTIGGAVAADADEETQAMLKIARTLAARPSVAFLSKIAQVVQQPPPRAPEPDLPPPVQAVITPTTQVTVDDNGIERIGVDFDVQVTASDEARTSSPPASPQTTASLALPLKFGRTRTISINGKQRWEVEVIYPHGTQWQEVELDVNLDKDDAGSPGERSAPTKEQVDEALTELRAAFEAREIESTPAPADAAPLPSAPTGYGDYTPDPQLTKEYKPDPAFSDGKVSDVFPPPPAAPGVPLSLPPGIVMPSAPVVSGTCTMTSTVTVIHGAVVVDLGDQAAEMRALFEKLTSDVDLSPRKSIAGVEFAHVEADQPIWLGFHETYLILAFDDASAKQVISGLSGQREAPAWLVDLEKKLPVERPIARLHVNIDAVAKLVDEPLEEETKAAVKLLGLDQVSAISWVAGLDDVGTAVKTLIATRDGGDVSAVLDIFGDKGLTADDLKAIPKDATMAAAGKFDAKRIVELGVKLAALDDDEAESAWEAVKKQLAEQMFIDLSKDLLEAIGDTWTLHYSPSEGGLMATTFTLAVRDEKRITAALEKLALVANADSACIRKFTYRGQDVYYWQDDGGSAAWCIRDGRLVASMLPQTIKAYIARGPLKETLADVAEVKPLLSGGEGQGGPLVLTYTDTRDILRWCYQYGSFLLPTIGQALSEAEESGFALHEIPSLAVIEQYFAPSITTLSRTDAGLLVDSRQTVPFASGVFALTALSGVGGGVYEMAFDDSGLGDIAQVAESAIGMPLGISFGSPAVSGQCINGTCSPYQPAASVSPYATLPNPYLTPQSQPGPYTPPPPPPSPPMPYGTPVPYKTTQAIGEPYVPPPATPPTVPTTPRNVPATYPAPAAVGVPVQGRSKVFRRADAPAAPTSYPIPAAPRVPTTSAATPYPTYPAPGPRGVAVSGFPAASEMPIVSTPIGFPPPPQVAPYLRFEIQVGSEQNAIAKLPQSVPSVFATALQVTVPQSTPSPIVASDWPSATDESAWLNAIKIAIDEPAKATRPNENAETENAAATDSPHAETADRVRPSRRLFRR